MPKFDKTGPEGKGPNTGRGAGKCEGTPALKDRLFLRLGRKLGRRQGRPRNSNA